VVHSELAFSGYCISKSHTSLILNLRHLRNYYYVVCITFHPPPSLVQLVVQLIAISFQFM
jgi:hypothetical protein